MSWSDIVNEVVVGRSSASKVPTKTPRGIWLEDKFLNDRYDDLVENRAGPTFSIEGNRAVYTYTITERVDAFDKLKAHIHSIIFDEQEKRANAGLTLSGLEVDTSDGALGKAESALLDFRGDPGSTRKYNTRTGGAEITVVESQAIVDAIKAHKQTANDWGYDWSTLLEDAGVITLDDLRDIETQIWVDIAQ